MLSLLASKRHHEDGAEWENQPIFVTGKREQCSGEDNLSAGSYGGWTLCGEDSGGFRPGDEQSHGIDLKTDSSGSSEGVKKPIIVFISWDRSFRMFREVIKCEN